MTYEPPGKDPTGNPHGPPSPKVPATKRKPKPAKP